MEKITLEEARRAYQVLLAFGKQSFQPDYVPSSGQKAACAIIKIENYNVDFAFDAAAVLVEQCNHHDVAEYLRKY